MGKKAQIGKRRKDKFYQLAKETGYRARSAFKLIQLNRKFQFLQQSRVLIDLCSAPGGWLQVASKYMPVSSVIIGVDLVSIKPIHNVITIEADITTPKCKQLLQKELKQWKVDCVLNDGAPNVGSAWIQDAFTQAQLTLSALKLSSEFLRPGGWFITKVFRSKDYPALLTVFRQLFTKVHATKPQASRAESAEIFVVCQGYQVTGKPDPKLLDPKFVFQEQTSQEKTPLSLQQLHKHQKSAEGYPEGQNVLHQSTPVLDFVMNDNYMELLAAANCLVFDKSSEIFKKHPATTEDILQYCTDIKVLGLRELKELIKWREKLKEFIDSVNDEETPEKEQTESEDEETNLNEIDMKVKELAKEELAEVKRVLRRQKKQRKKTVQRLATQLETQKDLEEIVKKKDDETFSLQAIKSSQHLEKINSDDIVIDSSSDDEHNAEPHPSTVAEYSDNDELDNEEELSNEEEIDKDNPLLVDLMDKESKRSLQTAQWFSNPVFADIIEDEIDEDEEISQAMERFNSKRENECNSVAADNETIEGETPDDKPDDNKFLELNEKQTEIRKLDPSGLAIGALMVQSRKKRQDLIDSSYNRWTNDDPPLPDWFVEDENNYCQKQLPITKDMVNEYRKKLKEINARPIKKIAEAKARKKHRAIQKLDKARKKAQIICNAADVTDQEKVKQIKSMYKKVGLIGHKKQEVKYVVAKKGLGKRVRRPPGVNGRFKVVDPRMKKDNRKEKMNRKKKGKNY